MTNEKLDAVLRLAEQGFKLIPCRGKKPILDGWTTELSGDPQRLREWFADSRTNIGIVTGAVSGVFVIDPDGKTGEKSLNRLEERRGKLPVTRTAITGKGRHLYFKHPGQRIKNNNTGKLGKKLDVRGDDGYVIAPPSIHPNGKQYAWVDETVPVAVAPDWLLSLLTAEDVPSERIPKGERNPRLHAEVCELYKTYLPEDVLPHALAFNAQNCDPPLSDEKVKDIVERVALTHKPLPLKIVSRSNRNPLRWFAFDANDFFADQAIQTLTDYQQGWRTRLIAFAWLNRGRLVNDPAQLAKLANARSPKRFKAEMKLALFDFEPIEEDGVHYLLNEGLAAMHAEKLAGWEQKRQAGIDRARQRELERSKKKGEQIPNEAMKEAA
jgi:hypothetical protein